MTRSYISDVERGVGQIAHPAQCGRGAAADGEGAIVAPME